MTQTILFIFQIILLQIYLCIALNVLIDVRLAQQSGRSHATPWGLRSNPGTVRDVSSPPPPLLSFSAPLFKALNHSGIFIFNNIYCVSFFCLSPLLTNFLAPVLFPCYSRLHTSKCLRSSGYLEFSLKCRDVSLTWRMRQ